MSFSNGQAKPGDLAPLNGGGQLRGDAARAYNALDRYLRVSGKGSLSNAGGGATYRAKGNPSDYPNGPFTQWHAWRRYQNGGNLAARPGTSNHGLGLAVDFTPAAIPLVAKYGNAFGWAKHGDAMGENWHYTYKPGKYGAVDRWSKVRPGETVSPGDCGPGVTAMKNRLKAWGCWPRTWRINDKYAGRTGKAVIAFQKAHHLKPDGIVGPGTWKALNAAPPVAAKRPIVKPKPKVQPVPVNKKYFADIYSGDTIYDAKKYQAAGYGRIALKFTEGRTYTDLGYAKRWNDSKAMIRWAYHFARPETNSAQDEAANFAKALQAVHVSSADRLVLDWESPNYKADGSAWVQAFVDAMAKYGYEVRVVYSYGPYLASTLKRWPKSKVGPLRYWHAAYNFNPEATVPAIAKPHLVAVQFTDGKDGNLPHIAVGIGPCDISYTK